SRFRPCRPADSTWVDRTAGWSAGGPSGIFSVARVLGRRSSEMSRRRRGLHRRVLARRCRPLPPPLVPGALWRHEPGPPRTRTRRNPMNSLTLTGRLTPNPQTHAGTRHESATFRLAVPRPGSDGADFVDIVCFDKLASTCGDWLTKGRGRGRQAPAQRVDHRRRRAPLAHPGRGRRRPVPRPAQEARRPRRRSRRARGQAGGPAGGRCLPPQGELKPDVGRPPSGGRPPISGKEPLLIAAPHLRGRRRARPRRRPPLTLNAFSLL